MPLELKRGGKRGAEPDTPAAMLLACHEKIRGFASLALELASATAPPEREIADAAAAVHRYFAVALPLHVQDEERSIRPRLVALEPEGATADALEVMAREHTEHDQLLSELIPSWATLASDPLRRVELAPTLGHSRELAEVLRKHLEVEEARIFPVLERLPEALSREILAEMRGRRTPRS